MILAGVSTVLVDSDTDAHIEDKCSWCIRGQVFPMRGGESVGALAISSFQTLCLTVSINIISGVQ